MFMRSLRSELFLIHLFFFLLYNTPHSICSIVGAKKYWLREYMRNEKETEFQEHLRRRAVIELVLRSAEGRSWLQGHLVDPRGKN